MELFDIKLAKNLEARSHKSIRSNASAKKQTTWMDLLQQAQDEAETTVAAVQETILNLTGEVSGLGT